MSTRGSRSIAVLVALALIPVVGCGGDDDQGSSTEDYISKADAICKDADTAQTRVSDKPGVYGENFSDPKVLAQYNDIIRGALAELEELDAPEEESEAVDRFLAGLKDSVAAIDRQVAALKAKDTAAQSEANKDFITSYGDVQAASGAIGLSQCQGLGN